MACASKRRETTLHNHETRQYERRLIVIMNQHQMLRNEEGYNVDATLNVHLIERADSIRRSEYWRILNETRGISYMSFSTSTMLFPLISFLPFDITINVCAL